jgi:hypothetical protein
MVAVTLIGYVIALAAAIVLAAVRRRRAAAGVFTGMGASVLILVVTSFASVSTGRLP